MKIVSAGRTDPGNVRPNNEDALLVDDEHRLYAVADGIGGHVGGEVASRLAIDALSELLRHETVRHTERTPAHAASDETDSTKRQAALLRAVLHANAVIRESVKQDPALTGMGTTLTALALQGSSALIAHIGDSRAYLLRNGTCRQVTSDHAVVAEYVRAGLLTAEQARKHPLRNVITRALGMDEQVQVDRDLLTVRSGDTFLLCTDGLTELVDDEELTRALLDQSPAAAVDHLIGLAKTRGGRDNITVVVIRVGE
jgi:protein phosphatase